MSETPELLAPAGNWDCVRAAVANGADAVYFGLPRFNARLRADNFREDELPQVVEFLHRHGVKAYVAFNTLVFTDELEAAAEELRLLNSAGVDALIVQDLGLVRLASEIVPQLPIHASTQMTITSPEGIDFVRELGLQRVVLARELSLRELKKFDAASMPLEVFVHGALCVAYSGQCLTSESLGQRSANRGECAQACRMPYQLIVDGVVKDLGDKRYLLSPQDLAAIDEIPALVSAGVVSFKIEGRLKSPEYVAAVTQVYRKAIDAVLEGREHKATAKDRYQLEMTFSRGLFSGWMHGVNHQKLVSGRFGKKRGPFMGEIISVGKDHVEIQDAQKLSPGDGIVFDTGGDTNREQGGRIYQIRGNKLYFRHRHIDFSKLKKGDYVWKTDDPELNKRLKTTFSGNISNGRSRKPIEITVRGKAGEPMVVEAMHEGKTVSVKSALFLQEANNYPLTAARLEEHLGRFADTGYQLGLLNNELEGEVILPIGELNRLRREAVFKLDEMNQCVRVENPVSVKQLLSKLPRPSSSVAQLSVLCRTPEQIAAALDCGIKRLYVDFEDIRRYRDAVAQVRACAGAEIFVATPRIQKAGEQGFFKLIENAEPDGVLIRNLGAIAYFRKSPLKKVGDFSLNVANPFTAEFLKGHGLEVLTISYDLNIQQVLALLENAPASWFELTIHQHMPMFHMEHCVFAAFLSEGTDHTNCGRPCDEHRVHLKDRVGMEHPLRADVGCRNTLFNAVAQTGAQYFEHLEAAGLGSYRIEFLEEGAQEVTKVITAYQNLLKGGSKGDTLWKSLRAQSQLGVTRGTLEV